MAGRPIEIPIAITADGAEKGASKVTDAFEQIEDSLKDLTKAGDKTSERLEDDMSDAAKKISRDLTRALEDVEDQAKTSGKSIGRHVTDGADKAGEGFSEMKDEAKGTAKEAAASFGSIEDGADALQEILANAFSGFGPAGMAAGALAAVGVGFAITALQEGADEATAMQEAAVAMAGKIEEAGGRIEDVDIAGIISEWGREVQGDNWMTFWADESESNFQKVAKQAKEAGVTSNDAIRGMKGTAEDSQGFLDGTQKEWDELTKTIEAGKDVTEEGAIVFDEAATAAIKKKNALGELRDGAQKNLDTTEEAIDIYNIEKGAIEGVTDATKESTEAIEERKGALKDSILSEHDYIESVGELDAKLKENGDTLDRNTQKGRDNEKAVLDQAEAIEQMAQDAIDAGGDIGTVTKKFEAQKEMLIKQVMPAFGGSREKAKAYIDKLLQTPKSISTAVNVTGIAAAEAKVRAFTDVGRHIQVNFRTGETYSVENYIQGMKAGVTVPVNFAARGKPAIG